VWTVTGAMDGTPLTGWITFWSCGPGRADMLAVALLAESDPQVLQALLGARCARAGEPLPTYPRSPTKG
jgi:hypothetical protein